MTPYRLYITLVFLGTVFSVKADPTNRTSQTGRTLAVIIGISDYQHITSLNYADDDALRIYDFLQSPQGGDLPDEQIRLLTNEQATRNNILQVLLWASQEAVENDIILFYFSGHGEPGSLLPTDFDGASIRVNHSEVMGLLSASRARHSYIWVDACNSGSLLAAPALVKTAGGLSLTSASKSAVPFSILASSMGVEESFECGELRSGIFSYYLLAGLQGAADLDHNMVVTWTELYEFVIQQVRYSTASTQNPIGVGRVELALPVARLGS